MSGNKCRLRFLRRVLGALLRPFGRRVLAPRRSADEAAEIGHAHIARGEIGSDLGPRAGAIDVEIAFEIALADAADELGEADGLAAVVVIEMTAQRIRRRWLQRQTEELVEIGKVLALKLELEIGTAELLGMIDRAGKMHMRIARRRGQLDRIGLGAITQRENRAADEMPFERLAAIGSLRIDHDLLLVFLIGRLGLHFHLQIGFEPRIGETEITVGNDQRADAWWRRIAGRILRDRERPIGIALGARA